MSGNITFTAQSRQVEGKKVKQLRAAGQIPANIHGAVKQTVSISVPNVAFRNLYQEVGETGLIYMTIEGDDKKARPVMIDEVQADPVSGDPLHIVFKQVNLKEKISAEIPLEFVGEYNVPDSVLVTVKDSVEMEALPTDFPESIEVDLSQLQQIGDSILLSSLKFDTSKLSLQEEDLEQPIVMLQEQRAEEPEESEAEAEGEATGSESTEAGSQTESSDEAAE